MEIVRPNSNLGFPYFNFLGGGPVKKTPFNILHSLRNPFVIYATNKRKVGQNIVDMQDIFR